MDHEDLSKFFWQKVSAIFWPIHDGLNAKHNIFQSQMPISSSCAQGDIFVFFCFLDYQELEGNYVCSEPDETVYETMISYDTIADCMT